MKCTGLYHTLKRLLRLLQCCFQHPFCNTRHIIAPVACGFNSVKAVVFTLVQALTAACAIIGSAPYIGDRMADWVATDTAAAAAERVAPSAAPTGGTGAASTAATAAKVSAATAAPDAKEVSAAAAAMLESEAAAAACGAGCRGGAGLARLVPLLPHVETFFDIASGQGLAPSTSSKACYEVRARPASRK